MEIGMQEKGKQQGEGKQEEEIGKIRMLTQENERYPARLREIPDPPKRLYVLGRLPLEELPSVALIGARDCSEYGRLVAAGLGEHLGKNGIQVISGMARGIDGIGQAAALRAGGSSFAVLGSGVDVCYPAGNRKLYEGLLLQGGVVSEYPPGMPAFAHNFPPRNRIVSGLADAVIVVEARVKSGTLITVDMALEQGKEIYAVPGRVTDVLSSGCNRLLKYGATPLPEPEELVEELWKIFWRRRGAAGFARTEGTEREKEMGRKEKRETGSRAKREEPEGIPDKGKKNKRRTDCCAAYCQELSERQQLFLRQNPDLAAIYECLRITPETADDICERLPQKYRGEQMPVLLMRLCVEGLAQQVSPGKFRRV